MRTQVFRIQTPERFHVSEGLKGRVFIKASWTVMLAEVNKDHSIVRPLKVWRRYTTERSAKQAANAMYRNEEPDIRRVAVVEVGYP